jgi:hypothetical protein
MSPTQHLIRARQAVDARGTRPGEFLDAILAFARQIGDATWPAIDQPGEVGPAKPGWPPAGV